jgi:hypothetical protein
MSIISGFRFASDQLGLGDLILSVAHGTVADHTHTKNTLSAGQPVVAISTVAGVGTYAIYGMAVGGSTTDNPYAQQYDMIHTVRWMGGPVFIPVADVPVCTTNAPSTALLQQILGYVLAQ